MMTARIALLATLVFALVFTARAHDQEHPQDPSASFAEKSALERSQAAVGTVIGDYWLVDSGGRSANLAAFRGQPVVISLIYTSCYHTCPMLTSHLAEVVGVARDALGEDSFSVLTIGFDTPIDTPGRMRLFAKERDIGLSNWYFLSSDAATMEELTRDLGFTYFRSPKGFDHLSQTTVIDGEGRVYRQVYGESFEAPTLVEPLKQLVFGEDADPTTLAGWLNGVRLFCTVYDPTSGRYRFDYSLFVAIAVGFVSLGSIAVFVVRAWRQSGKRTFTA